jgi:lipid A 4'-phosphatase
MSVILIKQLILLKFSYFKSKYFKQHLYIALVGIIGVYIVVYGCKNYFHRPRPYYIQEFKGNLEYISPWSKNLNYIHNNDIYKSFISGHTAEAALLYTIFFIERRTLWFYIATFWTCIMGLFRVIQGAHFCSDVIFAGLLTYGIAMIFYYIICKPSQIS